MQDNLYEAGGASGAVSFTRAQAFLVSSLFRASWLQTQHSVLQTLSPLRPGQSTGQLSVKIRTTEPTGLIFHSKGKVVTSYCMRDISVLETLVSF